MKRKHNWIIWLVIAVVAFIANIAYAIWAEECKFTTNILTVLSGWISGISTIAIGVVAAYQSSQYNKGKEVQERSIDLVVESIDIGNYVLPKNFMNRYKTANNCDGNIIIKFFNIRENPVFYIDAESLSYGDYATQYNIDVSINKDIYGKSFLTKNEAFYLKVGYETKKFNGKCTLEISFYNQYGDKYKKKIQIRQLVNLDCSYYTEITELVSEGRKNG